MQLSIKQKVWRSFTIAFALLLLERFFLSEKFPTLSNLVKVDPELMIFHYAIPLPKFGLAPVLIIVFGALALSLIPYKNLGSGTSWKLAFSVWRRTLLLSVLIPGAMVMGAFIYFLLKDNFPAWARGIFESFGIAFTPTMLGTDWPPPFSYASSRERVFYQCINSDRSEKAHKRSFLSWLFLLTLTVLMHLDSMLKCLRLRQKKGV